MTTDRATDDQSSGMRPRPSAVTLRDVADAAGVSKASASRALDPTSQYVSPELRERVLGAARRLGYSPNASARATTTGATSMVAVLVSDIRDPYNAEIVHGVIERAARSGLVATFAGTDHAIDDETRAVRMMRSLRPHAMILTGARSGTTVSRAALEEELQRYRQEDGRVVIAGDDELPFDTAVVPADAALRPRRGAVRPGLPRSRADPARPRLGGRAPVGGRRRRDRSRPGHADRIRRRRARADDQGRWIRGGQAHARSQLRASGRGSGRHRCDGLRRDGRDA
ncbi:hypothetical protein GCM10029992_50470 [Glycomyces albus]